MRDNLVDKVYTLDTQKERYNLIETSQNWKDEYGLLPLASAIYSNLTK